MALPKEKRLLKRRDFLRAQRQGARSFGQQVTVVASHPPKKCRGKLGITVPKSVGNACTRNRVKRRLRHICRDNQWMIANKTAVIIARPSSATCDFKTLMDDVISCFFKAKPHQKKNFQANKLHKKAA